MKKVISNLSLFLLGLFLSASFVFASENSEAILIKDMPKLLGSTNQGTEFYLTFHPGWTKANENNKIIIYITSSYATKVTLEIPTLEIFLQKNTIVNGVIEFELDPQVAQCYMKTDGQAPENPQVYKGRAIIIKSEAPIICFGMARHKDDSEGFIAIPKVGLGKNYIVAAYNDPCQDNGNQYLTSYMSIIGVADKTTVNLTLGGRFSNYTSGSTPLRTGDKTKETLNRGDVWLIGVKGDYSDLTGTEVNANKPVAVISGSFCAYVPIQVSGCSYLIEQNLPIESWGCKYHVAPIFNRQKSSVIRVFTSAENNTIYKDGSEWSLVKTIGGEEGTGYIERRVVAETQPLKPVVISAKKPIQVIQYNTGKSDDKGSAAPFEVALVSVEQYQKSFLWCTPGSKDGYKFQHNYLNLCYKATAEGKIPEDIEFGKSINGIINWQKLSAVISNPGQEFIDTSDHSPQKYRVLTLELDDPAGVYSLRGIEPMGAYAYGTDLLNSYGYAVTVSVADITKADVMAPSVTYNINCDGLVEGKVFDEPQDDNSLRSNLGELSMIKYESFNYSDIIYDEVNFNPGLSKNMNWSVAVLDPKTDAKAVLKFMDRAGNDTTITIEYHPVQIQLDKNIYDFGINHTNSFPSKQICELENKSISPVVVDSIYVKSKYSNSGNKFAGFKINNNIYQENGGQLPKAVINPGEKLSFEVIFEPASIITDYEAGKKEFIDSIGIKAHWSDYTKTYCFDQSIACVSAKMEKNDTLPPVPTYKICCCGNTVNGDITDEPQNDPANRSNLYSITQVKEQSYNCTDLIYDKDKFIPGVTSYIKWSVNTINPNFDAKVVLKFADLIGNDTTIEIELNKAKILSESNYEFKDLDTKESHTYNLEFKNISKKSVILDSIQLLSSDKLKEFPKSGFSIDTAIYKTNGGVLPGYEFPSMDKFEFKINFNPSTVKDLIDAGQTIFVDSLIIKADWDSETNSYCINKSIIPLRAIISSNGVNDLSEKFGIIDIAPNPTKKSGTILHYNLQYGDNVIVSIYNSNGSLISNLLNSCQSSGSHTFTIPTDELSPGVYILNLKVGKMIDRKSFVVVK